MRCLVVLACVCAVAYARAQISEESSAIDENPAVETVPELNEPEIKSSDVGEAISENKESESNDDEELDVAPTNLAPSVVKPTAAESNYNDEDLDVSPTNLVPSVVKSDESARQGRYRAVPDQYEEGSAPRSVGKLSCKEKNERYSVPGSCDRYVECLNGTAEEKQCPDGLRYNPNVLFNVYPCQYPVDVPCLARSSLQPAQPTADCPHQFGYFKTGDSRNCSGFRNCVNGVGYDFTCPDGLAFSPDNYRCEWPDEVSDCDAEAFLGFRCPEVPVSKELGPPAGFRYYRSPSDCQVYFICIDGKPRRLACGGYSAFDEQSESCVNAEEISACPQELKTRAAQAKESEERRQKLLQENPFKTQTLSPRLAKLLANPESEQNLDDTDPTPTQLSPETE
ncbi:protein obstructor-E-like [Bicyclus anynana]|uniref:Protein obstructor-E-like n=1 Tax=Bicyclus anynana TaxID=110368 RepID=A0ABM3LDM8_BICAN|nr:protein obstructor-E-like [Bicyclus anynana]